MAIVFALALQKGGVGKTTTTLNLGANLAKKGKKVLLIDMDPQANLSQGLGVNIGVDELKYSVYEVLLNPEQGIDFATLNIDTGLDLVPSKLSLSGAELELAGKVGRELFLKDALKPSLTRYDYIFIDSPPNLGLFTINALTASNQVLVPLQLHVYAYQAMPELEKVVKLVKKINPDLFIGGIICTQEKKGTKLNELVERNIRNDYGAKVFKTVIPYNITVAEAPASGKPLFLYDPNSAGAKAYEELSNEFLEYYG
jgi:chromosome partitioning protein